MKALILSISTGQGHHATGAAIKNCFESMDVKTRVLDAYEYVDPKLSKFVSKSYALSAAHAARASSKLYDLVARKNKPARIASVTNMTNTVIAWDLKKYIKMFAPEIIICTHVLSAMHVSKMKTREWTRALTAGIVTDFTVHPMWQETHNLDYYVTPNELLDYQMAKKGINLEKVLPLGIPIRAKFSNRMTTKQAREELKLEQEKNTILLMSGSMGYGKMDKSLEKLDNLPLDFQTIVVCGNNKEMYRKIRNKSFKKRVDVYGYTDQVDIMMDAADCIITKPGGITSSEALAKGLPMIMVNPIPGHEQRNAEFMLNNGIALYATKSFPVDEAVFSLFKNNERLDELKQTIELFGRRNAAQNLCEFLIEKVKEKK